MKQTKRIRIRDRSVETFKSYLTEHLWFGVVMGINVYELLPIIVPIAYLDRSIPRLILCMVGTGCVGILFTYRYNRSFWGVLMDTNLGLGMYVVLTVGKYSPAFIIWTLAATCAFTMLSLIRIWCRGIRRNMAILATVLVVVLPLSLRFFKTEALSEAYINQLQAMNDGTSEEIAVHQTYGDEYRMAENIDTISLIRNDDTFQSLNCEQKQEVIEAIIYCEARYLGLCKINVKFEDLDENTLGVYNHEEKNIYINKKLLQENGVPGVTAEKILQICLHECRHSYQNLLVEMYKEATPEQRALILFRDQEVDEWVRNFNDYRDSADDLEDYLLYYIQPIERDARRYADEQVEIYYAEIDSLLAEQNSQ